MLVAEALVHLNVAWCTRKQCGVEGDLDEVNVRQVSLTILIRVVDMKGAKGRIINDSHSWRGSVPW